MRYNGGVRWSEVAVDPAGRPILDEALREFCRALAAANPDALRHIAPERIVFVAGAARRSARASVRPLTLGGEPPLFRRAGWEKPQVWLFDRPALYEICLRPRYFLEAAPDERVRIICHELWHMNPAFDGTLDPARRHRNRSPAGSIFDEQADRTDDKCNVEPWVTAWRASGAVGIEAFTFAGELRLSAWTARPPSRLGPTGRRRYSQADLHLAIVQQR